MTANITTGSVLDRIVSYTIIVALIFLGSVLYSEVKKNAALETQAQVQSASIQFMKEKQEEMDKATKALNDARNDIQGIRAEIRKSIKKAMQDETYKAYRESLVHPESVRVLREANDSYRSVGTEASHGTNAR